MTALGWVVLGSALGAPARYLLDRLIQERHERVFPWGTFVNNLTGSFVLGLVVGLAAHHTMSAWVLPAVATGFLGGYTTFSTFTWESLRLMEDGAVLAAWINVASSAALGLAAAAVGLLVGSW
jgi:CrcB protein